MSKNLSLISPPPFSRENAAILRNILKKTTRWSRENEALVLDFPQKVKVEDVKTTLSRETSLKKWNLMKFAMITTKVKGTDDSLCNA